MNAESSTRFPTFQDAQHLPSGTALQNGLFTVRGVLGSGGFGITYRAFDPNQNREVAVKELFTADCSRVEKRVELKDDLRRATFFAAKKRFLEQARTLERLRHPNIVRVLSHFEENATAYLVMELLVGQNLSERVAQNGAFPESEALNLVEKVGDATEAIHRLGLLHLDIKPENVILTEANRVVLMDFDLVQKLHSGAELQTRPLDAPSHCGTPGYAPIEQYSLSARLSPATDIYALGATLFHLVTARPPAPSLQRAHENTLIFPPQCGENMRRAIEKSLQIETEKRPQNVRDFREMLRLDAASSVAPEDDEERSGQPKTMSQNGVGAAARSANSAASAAVSNVLVSGVPFSGVPFSTVPILGAPLSNHQAMGGDRVWRVRVAASSTRTVSWPDWCPCCGDKIEQGGVFWEIGKGASRFRVPHCEWCVQHIDSSRTAVFVGAWGMIGGLLVAWLGLEMSDLFLGPIGLVIHLWGMSYGILKSVSADTMKKPACPDKKSSVRVREIASNYIVFEFRRRDFADAFRQLNGATWG